MNASTLELYDHVITGWPVGLIVIAIAFGLIAFGYFTGHKQGVKDGMRMGLIQEKIHDVSRQLQ